MADHESSISGWGIFFLIAFVLIVVGGVGWILFTQYRARRLGLPAPSLNPFTRGGGGGRRPLQNSYAAPAPAPGGITGWFSDKFKALRHNRTAGGAYERSGGYGASRRGFGALDPDEAWDARVGNEADYTGRDGYYEEQELASSDPNSGPYGGHGYGGGNIGVGGIEEGRGRSASRQRELDHRYDEEVHGSNPFGDDTAERSSMRPTVNTTVGASIQRPPNYTHKSQQSLGADSVDAPSERRSIFRENM